MVKIQDIISSLNLTEHHGEDYVGWLTYQASIGVDVALLRKEFVEKLEANPSWTAEKSEAIARLDDAALGVLMQYTHHVKTALVTIHKVTQVIEKNVQKNAFGLKAEESARNIDTNMQFLDKSLKAVSAFDVESIMRPETRESIAVICQALLQTPSPSPVLFSRIHSARSKTQSQKYINGILDLESDLASVIMVAQEQTKKLGIVVDAPLPPVSEVSMTHDTSPLEIAEQMLAVKSMSKSKISGAKSSEVVPAAPSFAPSSLKIGDIAAAININNRAGDGYLGDLAFQLGAGADMLQLRGKVLEAVKSSKNLTPEQIKVIGALDNDALSTLVQYAFHSRTEAAVVNQTAQLTQTISGKNDLGEQAKSNVLNIAKHAAMLEESLSYIDAMPITELARNGVKKPVLGVCDALSDLPTLPDLRAFRSLKPPQDETKKYEYDRKCDDCRLAVASLEATLSPLGPKLDKQTVLLKKVHEAKIMQEHDAQYGKGSFDALSQELFGDLFKRSEDASQAPPKTPVIQVAANAPMEEAQDTVVADQQSVNTTHLKETTPAKQSFIRRIIDAIKEFLGLSRKDKVEPSHSKIAEHTKSEKGEDREIERVTEKVREERQSTPVGSQPQSSGWRTKVMGGTPPEERTR
jgi:hypothetical protein